MHQEFLLFTASTTYSKSAIFFCETHEKSDTAVKNCIDLYPFGAPMPNRTFSSENYRYGFNGKENDNEIAGVGNEIDFGSRIYDSRLGRWLSVDPLQKKYPNLSPYNFCSNNPIYFIDPNGMEIVSHRTKLYVFADEAKLYLGKDVRLSEYPQNIHELGVTGLGNDLNGRKVWYKFNEKTKSYDVHYNLYVFMSATLKSGAPMDNANPGLNKEVEAHEDSHGDQWDEAFKTPIVIRSGSFTFEGTIDDILKQADKAFNEVKKNNPKAIGKVTKAQFLDNIFKQAVGEVYKNFQNQAKPDVETDANKRAMKKTNNKMPYTNGNYPIKKPNGETLKSNGKK